ncbi:MAG: ABC transporter substrate-binding protein [Candidatus Sericytochromatia bacterium]
MTSQVKLPATFNPYLATDNTVTDVTHQLFLGLIKTDPVTGQISPALAESWRVSPDQRTYTLTLRKGLKWSDGKPLTADDVVFTYTSIIDNELISSIYRDSLLVKDVFPGVQKQDQHTVVFTTPEPFAPFLQSLDSPILPAHVFKGSTVPDEEGEVAFNQIWDSTTAPEAIVVNGPWQPEAYVPGERLVLKANPFYYRKDAKGTQLPYLKHFEIREVGNADELDLFLKGQIQAFAPKPSDLTQLAASQKPFTLANLGASSGSLFVMFNQSTAQNEDGISVVNPIKSAWFRNKAFRQALAHAIDKQGMIQDIYGGHALPQFSHITQLNPFYNPNTKQYDYNLEKAQALLSAAGFKKNAKGELLDPKGNRVAFDLATNANNPLRDASCVILRRDWGKLGIQVNYKALAFEELVTQIDQTLDWDAILIGLTGNAIEPHFGINTWQLDGSMHMFNMGHPSAWPGQKATQFAPWEKEVLALYEKAATEFDAEKRKQYYWESQQIVADNLPFIYTVAPLAFVAYDPRLENAFPHVRGGTGMNMFNWNTDLLYLKQDL